MIQIFQRLQQEFHRERMEVSRILNRGAHVTDHRIALQDQPFQKTQQTQPTSEASEEALG